MAVPEAFSLQHNASDDSAIMHWLMVTGVIAHLIWEFQHSSLRDARRGKHIKAALVRNAVKVLRSIAQGI